MTYKKATILLADDESLVRKGLRHILDKQPEYEIIGEACDGLMTIEKVAELKPEIVILDIRMPRMNGLEALKLINLSSQKSKVIILTAYNSFEYAVKALKLGAYDFLLKPVKLNELLSVLARVKTQIYREKTNKKYAERVEDQLVYARSSLREQFYLQLLNREFSKEELIEKMLVLNLKNHYVRVLLIGLDHSYRLRRCNSEDKYIIILHNIKKAIQKELEAISQEAIPVLELENAIFALLYPDLDTVGPKNFASNLVVTVRKKLEQSVSIAISSRFPLAKASSAYVEACKYLKQRIICGGNTIIDNKQKNLIRIAEYPHEIVTKIVKEVKLGNIGQVKTLIRILANYLRKERMSYESLYQILFSIITDSYQNDNRIDTQRVKIVELIEQIREVELLSSPEDLQLWLENNLNEISQRIGIGNAKLSPAIRKALFIIESRLGNDISLSNLAEQVCLSPNYLSAQLKLQTGMSFLKHLTEKKLREARQLLSHSLLNINQIADTVGYSDPKYFDEVFKRHYGITPSTFRKISQS